MTFRYCLPQIVFLGLSHSLNVLALQLHPSISDETLAEGLDASLGSCVWSLWIIFLFLKESLENCCSRLVEFNYTKV